MQQASQASQASPHHAVMVEPPLVCMVLYAHTLWFCIHIIVIIAEHLIMRLIIGKCSQFVYVCSMYICHTLIGMCDWGE